MSHAYEALAPLKDSPNILLERINRVLWEAGQGLTTMTFFAAFIDRKTGVMTYANAGHNHPFLIPEKETDKRLEGSSTKKPFAMIQSRGTPLGMDPDSTYSSKTLKLKSGDKLFLYTDGLIECRNPEGKEWGKRKMLKFLEEIIRDDYKVMTKKMIDTAFKFFNGQSIDDDVTVVVAEISNKNR